MVYRKGERAVIKIPIPWDQYHPVARCVADGDYWFDAWIGECCTPHTMLAKKSHVSLERITAISTGDYVARSELAAFATVWVADVEDVVASLPDPLLLIEDGEV